MKKILVSLTAALITLTAHAVDTLALESPGGQFSKIEYSWTSDGSGDAIGMTADVTPGVLFSCTTVPDTVAVPTDDYDVVIKQAFPAVGGSDSVLATDLAASNLLNRDLTNTELVEFWPSSLTRVQGKIRIEVSNAGSSKQGKITLIVYRTVAITAVGGTFALPPGGSSGQFLQWLATGQGKWVTASGDATLADGGAFTVANDSHAHTGTTLSGIDISDDTNLAGDSEVVLTGDGLSLASGVTRDSEISTEAALETFLSDVTNVFTNNDTIPAANIGNGLTDTQVSDTLTASVFKGSGTTTDAIDLATAEVAGTLPDGNIPNTLQLDVIQGSVGTVSMWTSTPTTANVGHSGLTWNQAGLVDYSGGLAVGNFASPSASVPFTGRHRPTDTSGQIYVLSFALEPNAGASSSAEFDAIRSYVNPVSAQTYSNASAGLNAFKAEIGPGVTGATSAAIGGLYSIVTNTATSGGTATVARNLWLYNFESSPAGSIPTWVGADILANTGSSIGSTSKYGLRVGNISGAATNNKAIETANGLVDLNDDLEVGSASTDTATFTARLIVRSVTDAGPMTSTNGSQREIVFNTSDSKFYGCSVTGSPATWVALN